MPRHDDEDQGIVALATRVGNLAGQVKRLADREDDRDAEIRALRQDVAELDNDVKELSERVPTKEQMKEVKEIIEDRAGRQWFQKRLRFYGWGLLAFLAAIYATREYLGPLFTFIGKLIKP